MTARLLRTFKVGALYLDGLKSVDSATVSGLAEFKGNLIHLNGLQSLK